MHSEAAHIIRAQGDFALHHLLTDAAFRAPRGGACQQKKPAAG